MNWKAIFSVVLINMALGIVMILGYLGEVQWWYGIISGIILALIMCWFVTEKLFKHGFIAGLISGLFSALITWLMWDTYVANSPQIAEAMSKMPDGGSLRTITLMTSPLSAAIGGVIMGVFCMLFGKLLGRSEEKPKPQDHAATDLNQSDTTPRG